MHKYRGETNVGPVYFTDQINDPDETAEIPRKRTIKGSVNTWHTIAVTCQKCYVDGSINKAKDNMCCGGKVELVEQKETRFEPLFSLC